MCWNSNNNTLDLLYTPNAQQARWQPFEFNFAITISVIWINKTVTNPKNWMWLKSLWNFLLILYSLPLSKVTIRIIIISVETSLSIIIVAHRKYYTFSFYIFQQSIKHLLNICPLTNLKNRVWYGTLWSSQLFIWTINNHLTWG